MSANTEQAAAQTESSPAVSEDLGIFGNAARDMYAARAANEQATQAEGATAGAPADGEGVPPPADGDKAADPAGEATGEGKPKKSSRNDRYKATAANALAEAKRHQESAKTLVAEKAEAQSKLEAAEAREQALIARLAEYGETIEPDENTKQLEEYRAKERAQKTAAEFEAEVSLQERTAQATSYLVAECDAAGADPVEVATLFRNFDGKKSLAEVIKIVGGANAPPKTEAELQLEANKESSKAVPVPSGAEPAALTETKKLPSAREGRSFFEAHLAEIKDKK